MRRPGTDQAAEMSPRERLVCHVQELERVEELRQRAAECVKESFAAAQRDGYDTATLKVVLRLRKMTPDQRRERRALEAIYLAALGMLEGDPLPDEARRRLDRAPKAPGPDPADVDRAALDQRDPAPPPPAGSLAVHGSRSADHRSSATPPRRPPRRRPDRSSSPRRCVGSAGRWAPPPLSRAP